MLAFRRLKAYENIQELVRSEMSMKLVRSMMGAFLIGGCLGFIGQLLVVGYSQVPAVAETGLTTIVVLITMGLLGGILFASGVLAKLEKHGGMATVLIFSGLPAAIGGIYTGVKMQTNSTGKAVLVTVVEIFLKVLLGGTLICAVIASLVFFTGGGQMLGVSTLEWSASTGGEIPPLVPAYVHAHPDSVNFLLFNIFAVPDASLEPLMFIGAFLVAGALSALLELITSVLKIKAGFLLFLSFFGLGSLLTLLGVMGFLVELGGGGVQVTFLDAGQAITTLFCFLLAGNIPGALPFVAVIGMFVIVMFIGIVSGMIRVALLKKMKPAQDDVAKEIPQATVQS
jgi:hypothetical protein